MGGDDSKSFAIDLFNAYLKYSSNLGFKTETIHDSDGHMIAKICGRGVGLAFQYESGKHCVQRIPDNDSKGRKQTSIVTVTVMPIRHISANESLAEKDIEVVFQTGKQGAGGQNVNRVKSAVRMKHKPTGISVFINGRDQGRNREEALRILTFRVNEQKRIASEMDYDLKRKNQMSGNNDSIGGRGDKIRTYNFIRSYITDHRLDISTNNVKEFMKGNFSSLFSS